MTMSLTDAVLTTECIVQRSGIRDSICLILCRIDFPAGSLVACTVASEH